MDKIQIVKLVTKTVVNMGTSTIINGIVKTNVQPQNVYSKVAVTCASVVIGMMAGEAVDKFTSEKIDEAVEQFNEIKSNYNTEKNTDK